MPNRRTRRWSPAEDDLVRTLSPDQVAAATKRTLGAVYRRRGRLGLSTPKARRTWTPIEDRLVRTLSPEAASAALGRSLHAVYGRRSGLGLAGTRRRWTPAEDRLVLSGKPRLVRATLPHRSLESIYRRRMELRANAADQTQGQYSARGASHAERAAHTSLPAHGRVR